MKWRSLGTLSKCLTVQEIVVINVARRERQVDVAHNTDHKMKRWECDLSRSGEVGNNKMELLLPGLITAPLQNLWCDSKKGNVEPLPPLPRPARGTGVALADQQVPPVAIHRTHQRRVCTPLRRRRCLRRCRQLLRPENPLLSPPRVV